MLIIIRPGFIDISICVSMALCSCLFWSTVIVITKKMSTDDSAVTILAYQYVIMIIFMSVLAIFFWQVPSIKSLVFIAEDNFLVCLVSGDKKCSLNKLKKLLNKKNVFMANADQVKENTGFSIGGVAPIGHLKKLNIIVDKSLNRFKYIYGAAGHPDCVFKITYSDLIKITTGSEKDITE